MKGSSAINPPTINPLQAPANYSDRSASTAFTRAARAAGTADAMTAAARITNADTTKGSIPGRCTSAKYLLMPRAKAMPHTTPAPAPIPAITRPCKSRIPHRAKLREKKIISDELFRRR